MVCYIFSYVLANTKLKEQNIRVIQEREDLPKSLYSQFEMSYNQLKSRFIDISAGMYVYIWRTTSLEINIIQNLDKGSASGELLTEIVDDSKNTRPTTSEQDYEEETDVDTDEENLNAAGINSIK